MVVVAQSLPTLGPERGQGLALVKLELLGIDGLQIAIVSR